MQSRFDFLDTGDFPELLNYCTKAEKSLDLDANITMLYLGKIGETIIQLIREHYNISRDTNIQDLTERGIIDENICLKINTLIDFKDDAENNGYNSQISAQRLMNTACDLCKWFADEFTESKFDFLADLPELEKLATAGREAEENLYTNTRYSLLCLGDIGEFIANFIMKSENLSARGKQAGKIQTLLSREIIDHEKSALLDKIREARNNAVHYKNYSEVEAKTLLDDALILCEWMFMQVISRGDTVSGTITGIGEESLSVKIGRLPGFVPLSEIPLEDDKKLSEHYHVGESLKFKVVELHGNTINLSLMLTNGNKESWNNKRFLKLCREGQHSQVQSAINEGANPNAANNKNFTAVMMAAYYNSDPEVISVLVKAGADINAVNKHQNKTALIIASELRGPAVIQALLNNGADITITDRFGRNAFSYARKNSKIDDELLARLQPDKAESNNAAVNEIIAEPQPTSENETTQGQDPQINESLADSNNADITESQENESTQGQDSNITDSEFIELCKNGTAQEISDAIKSGANVHAIDSNEDDNTALMTAAKYNHSPEVINILLDSGADIDAKNKKLRTPLILAVMNNNSPEVIEALCSRNADTSIQDINYKSALSYALGKYNDSKILTLLAKTTKPTDAEFLELCKTGTAQEISDAIEAGANFYARDFTRDDDTALMLSAKYNPKPEAVNALLDAGANIDALNSHRRTALILAVMNNNRDVIKALCARKPRIDWHDLDGMSAFDYAQERFSDDEEILQLLDFNTPQPTKTLSDSEFLELCKTGTAQEISDAIEAGANKLARDGNNNTPLIIAAEFNTFEVIDMLINEGCKVDAHNNEGYSALMKAAEFNTVQAVNILIQHTKLDIDDVENNGYTALMLAAQNNIVNAVESLINAGANVNYVRKPKESGDTPLMLAARFNFTDVVRLLLSKGANINAMTTKGFKAVDFALKNDKMKGTKILAFLLNNEFFEACRVQDFTRITTYLNAGANINVQDANGNTALIWAVRRNQRELVDSLLQSNADVNIQNKDGNTALMFAVSKKCATKYPKSYAGITIQTPQGNNMGLLSAVARNQREIVRSLLNSGANVYIQNKDGNTALILAVSRNQIKLANLLLNSDSNSIGVNTINNSGYTALDYAGKYFKALTDINAQDSNGNTALILAVMRKQIELVKFLLKVGVNVNKQNNNGNTALMFAASGNHSEIVNILLDHNADVNIINNSGHKALSYAQKFLGDQAAVTRIKNLTHN